MFVPRSARSLNLVSLVLWYDILNRTNPVSKLFQNPNLNILESTKSLKGLHTYFLDERNKEQFKKLIVDAGQLAEKLEMEATFIEEAKTEKYKIEIFYTVMDTISNANYFLFLYSIANLANIQEKKLLEYCMDLQIYLTDDAQ
ncbi:hypothetical protein ILUMI_07437 [Ignelater luminosus]|uniref:Uncharacterized protein n=1 Tax=Ignelater luminosus TaxID=2038154 RepID=A0A8K0GI24_IGNLU|nr:hypothetical protein ILUMI_07437 [Ignelater luminosus]